MSTLTTNGAASRCTCLNRFDHCAYCRALEAAVKANPRPAVKPAPEPPPKPRRRPKPQRRPRPDPEPPPADAECWLTPAQVARMLAVGIRTLRRMAADGQIPQPHRFTRKLVRWDYQTLREFLRKMREDAPGRPDDGPRPAA